MRDDRLRFVLRSPHEVVLDARVRSARVPTETGDVGLRVRMEPIVLAVEVGLVVLRGDQSVQFAGSAGGLLSCDGTTATLFTPIGFVGSDEVTVQAALDRALADPGAEQKVRAALEKLEGRILTELRRDRPTRPAAGGDGV